MSIAITPRGSDRSMTRAMYYTLRRLVRYVEWKNRAALNQCVLDSVMYGEGYLKVELKDGER